MAINQFFRHSAAVEHQVDPDAVEKSAHLGGLGSLLLRGQFGITRNKFVHIAFNASPTQRRMQLGQAFRFSGVTDRVEFEFERQQHAASVFKDRLQMMGQNIDSFFFRTGLAKLFAHVLLFAAQRLFEEREENIFLVAKIGVERTAGFAGSGGDVFNSRHFEAIAGKNVTSRFQKIAAC